jgi:hypothetical protein
LIVFIAFAIRLLAPSCFLAVLSTILFLEWKYGDAWLLVKAVAQARNASPRIEMPWLAAG